MTNIKDYLSAYNVNDLKGVARKITVKNFSKLKKDDLIDAIIERQKTEEAATYAYLYIDELSFENWKNDDGKENPQYTLEELFGLYIMGYAFESKEEENRFFITSTIADLFEKVDTKENKEQRLDVQRKLNLVRASLHLYGIVSIDQVLHLFKKYYDMDITEESLIKFLEESPYEVTINDDKREIVIDDMTEGQYNSVKKHLNNSKRPYYEPEFAKFIKFSNPNYIDESKDHLYIKEWVNRHFDHREEDNKFVYFSILQLIVQKAKRDQIIQHLMSLDVEFKNAEEQRNFFNSVDGVLKNTRHFKYRGHKESELKTKTIVHEVKVGRNEPCPCGSGKKYKKCCGK